MIPRPVRVAGAALEDIARQLDDEGTIVVYAIDIWPDRWPTE
ncbi:MAG: hypothetical protein R2733_03655 [Acidimicrobiales bacterium]